MLNDFRRVLARIPPRRRRQGWAIIALMFMGAAAEWLTIGAVVPFLSLVSDADSINRFPPIANALASVGISDAGEVLVAMAALFVVVAVVAAIIRLVLAWASQRWLYGVGYDLGVQLYENTLYRNYSYHVAHNSSRLVAQVQNATTVTGKFLQPAMQAVISTTLTIFIIAAIVVVDPVVALGSLLGFGGVYLLVSTAARRRLRRDSKALPPIQVSRIQSVQEGLGAIRDVILDHSHTLHVRKFAKYDRLLRNIQARNAFIGAAPRFVVEALGVIMIVALGLLLSYRTGGIAMALPTLGALAIGAQKLLPLLQLMYVGWTQMMGARYILGDILEVLEVPHTRLPKPEPLEFRSAIELAGVEFAYSPDGPKVLSDINLRIRKGESVGFMGATGSGKSTLIDIIMGLLEPSSGSVLIDGVALDQKGRREWRQNIAHVPQDIFLSDASIAENIAFGEAIGGIDMDRVREAARRARISDFIETLENGYETHVGERGSRLSGGQKQRLGIARALYKHATVLVLDEATSALDDATEAEVMRSIEESSEEVTLIIIAHRLSTLRSCSVVFELEEGRLSSARSSEEVLNAAEFALKTRLGEGRPG